MASARTRRRDGSAIGAVLDVYARLWSSRVVWIAVVLGALAVLAATLVLTFALFRVEG